MISNSLFLNTINVIGMFASYWTERHIRSDYLRRRMLEEQLRGLLPICAWCKKVRDDQGLLEPDRGLHRHALAGRVQPQHLSRVRREAAGARGGRRQLTRWLKGQAATRPAGRSFSRRGGGRRGRSHLAGRFR